MNNPPVPPSIEEIGLRNHLTALGVDYDKFVQILDEETAIGNGTPNKTRVADRLSLGARKVHRHQIRAWIAVYDNELSGHKEGKR